jgi:hypothetical protein
VAEAVPAVEEAPVAETPAVEEPVVEETPAPVAEETPAPVVEEVPAQPVELASMADIVKQFSVAVTTLGEAVKALAPAPAAEPKVAAEKALTNGQPADEVKTEREKALELTIADLQAQIADLSKPAGRKGALPVEDVPSPEADPSAQHVDKSAIGLREAVKRLVTSK